MNSYEALRQAIEAHAGQRDKCGNDYILHPLAVAGAVERTEFVAQQDAVVVALLHDVLEDTDYEPQGLSRSQQVALDALTRREVETYSEYLARLGAAPSSGEDQEAHRVACIVKLADLWHNLQPSRQQCLSEDERSSLEKRYVEARSRIWKALGFEWWPPPTDA